MAKAILPTNFTDDVLNESMDGKRRYNIIPNADGSQSLEDVTAYDQLGSNFGASNINAMNQAINESFDKNKMISDMDELDAVTQSGYGVDALVVKEMNDSLTVPEDGVKYYADKKDGKYGVNTDPSRGADTFIPFSGGVEKGSFTLTLNGFSGTANIEFSSPFSKIPIVMCVREDTQGFYGTISDITVNGCTIGVSSTSNNDKNGTFTWHWCAFEID